MKNYVKEGQKLPPFGIGPYLIYSMVFLSILCIVLFAYVFQIGTVTGASAWVFRIIGVILVLLGSFIWYKGALGSDMDKNISENRLCTTGIYAWVRNPMYSGIWIALSGVGFIWHNLFLLPLILIDWLFITIVLKNTEEKWLLKLYGREYSEYKKSVNRCIPWVPKEGH